MCPVRSVTYVSGRSPLPLYADNESFDAVSEGSKSRLCPDFCSPSFSICLLPRRWLSVGVILRRPGFGCVLRFQWRQNLLYEVRQWRRRLLLTDAHFALHKGCFCAQL